jgi:hypothetical protein|tara:strand:- start:998 stop:1102 length:105 start_codon:yes stop_codon:yes gene_type:complete
MYLKKKNKEKKMLDEKKYFGIKIATINLDSKVGR